MNLRKAKNIGTKVPIWGVIC